MFENCNQLQSLNLSNFNTAVVTNMEGLFQLCEQLQSLDISNFNTTLATNVKYMFNGLNSIKYINIYNIKDDNKLTSVLSQYLNKNITRNIIICQNQQIINNTNSITSCDYNNYIIVKYSKETKYTNI